MVAGGRHIVGHNMDWYVIDAVNNVLFDLTGPDGTRVMGLAGAPYLLMLGMNSHGVANVSNSVHSNDNRIGVPNVFVRRATLEARTWRRRGTGACWPPAPAAPTSSSPTPAAGSGTSRRRPPRTR